MAHLSLTQSLRTPSVGAGICPSNPKGIKQDSSLPMGIVLRGSWLPQPQAGILHPPHLPPWPGFRTQRLLGKASPGLRAWGGTRGSLDPSVRPSVQGRLPAGASTPSAPHAQLLGSGASGLLAVGQGIAEAWRHSLGQSWAVDTSRH